MEWSEVLACPYLQDLPFKIELNRYGTIMMSPASNRHSRIQARIYDHFLLHKKGGDCFQECSIRTSDGVKVADVVWASDKFMAKYDDAAPYPKAPEICVEVLSPSNSKEQMSQKIALYFERGAVEVWTVDEKQAIKFFSKRGAIPASKFFPDVKISVK